jgi:hypothetical protein
VVGSGSGCGGLSGHRPHRRRRHRGREGQPRPPPARCAQDLFLDGRDARVEGVFLDVDERRYLAVTLEDDPAAELHQVHGRFLYFAPDEVEPLEEPS